MTSHLRVGGLRQRFQGPERRDSPVLRRLSPVPLLALALALAPACLTPDPAPIVRGPLASRPQHPLGLTFLALRPRRAQTQPAGSTGIGLVATHSSIFEANAGLGDRVVFDGEVSRVAARVRHGLTESLDVEVELGLAYATSGFLDSVLDDFHGALFLPDGGRDEAPQDRFDMSIRRLGVVAYELEEDRIGFTDVPLIVTGELLDEDEGGWVPGVAARAAVELPVGSSTRGFGSGGLDWGMGVLAEKSTGRFTWTAAVDWILPDEDDAFGDVGIDIRNFLQLQGGAEMRWSNRCSLLAQIFITTPLTRDIDLEEINREIVDLGIGVAYDVAEASRLFVSFHEDIVAATGPDFGIRVGWTLGF